MQELNMTAAWFYLKLLLKYKYVGNIRVVRKSNLV